MSDPFHGLGPVPLMVGTILAGRAWRQTIRPALVRAGRLAPPPPTGEAGRPETSATDPGAERRRARARRPGASAPGRAPAG